MFNFIFYIKRYLSELTLCLFILICLKVFYYGFTTQIGVQLNSKNLIKKALSNNLAKNKLTKNKLISTFYQKYYQNTVYDFFDVDFFSKSYEEEMQVTSRVIFELWFLDQFDKNLKGKIKPYLRSILYLCEKYQIDPFLVVALINVESSFNSMALSPKGAKGLMQLMPKTKNYLYKKLKQKEMLTTLNFPILKIHFLMPIKLELNKKIELLNNLELGIYYFKDLMNRFENPIYAMVAYNMGPSWTNRQLNQNKIIGQKNRYVNKILKNYNNFGKY